MRRFWLLIAVSLGAALAACWDFEGAYDACVDGGRCSGGGGGNGGDGGDVGGGGDGGGGSDGGGDAGSDGGSDGGGGGSDAGPTCPPGAPTGNGLCLVGRFDRDAPMYGIYGVSPDLVYFGGNDEAVSIWQAGVMSHEVTGLTNGDILRDLSGTSENAIWAATSTLSTSNHVYRYNGLNWVDVTPAVFTAGDCNGAWSEDAGLALLACDQGLWQVNTLRIGQIIAQPPGVSFWGVWGIPGGPVWAVGGDSTAGTANIWERRGGTWKELAFPGLATLREVHGRSDRDVWAVGDGALLMHLTDAGWQTFNTTFTQDLGDVFVATSGEVWATTYLNRLFVIATDGGQRSFVPPGLPTVPGADFFRQIHVFDSGDLWITTQTDDGGSLYHGAEYHYRKL